MLFAEISETMWQYAIGAIVTVLLAGFKLIELYLSYKNRRAIDANTKLTADAAHAAAMRDAAAAHGREIVKQKLADTAATVKKDLTEANETTNVTLSAIAKSAQESHEAIKTAADGVLTVKSLVNGSMHIALKSNAVLAQKLADATKSQDDIEAAKQAQKKLDEHDSSEAAQLKKETEAKAEAAANVG